MTHDPQAPLTARWYCVTRDGLSTLCLNEASAREMAEQCDHDYPRHAPHRAVLMGDVEASERELERMHDVVRDVKAERDALREEAALWEERARHLGWRDGAALR